MIPYEQQQKRYQIDHVLPNAGLSMMLIQIEHQVVYNDNRGERLRHNH